MSPFARKGSDNPSSTLDAATVRKIRLNHLADGESISALARSYQLNVSCISRLVRWQSWAHSDEDLRAMPRPDHRGGGSRPVPLEIRRERKEALQKGGLTCHSCIHLSDKTGRCDLDFPECLSTAYKEAANCCCYKPSKANHESPD